RRAPRPRRAQRRAGGRARDEPDDDRRGDRRVSRRPAARPRAGDAARERAAGGRRPRVRRRGDPRPGPLRPPRNAVSSETRTLVAVIAAIGAVAIGSIAWIYGGDLTFNEQPVIRADGVGYYVYLPAALLDHDLTMRKTGARSFGG